MKNNLKLLIFDSHPIQYRAPLWKEINRLLPNKTKVVYASDFSLRGGMDRDFGKSITWDTPLLEGYSYIILNNQVGTNFSKLGSLSGKGVFKLIKDHKPKAIFLNALINNKFFLTVYFCALIFRIPIWLRHETQEKALPRGRLKNFIRSIFYRVLYLGINKAFIIGELNKQHYLKFGLDQKKMIPCRYGVLDSCSILNEKEKTITRTQCREELHITNDKLVITFSGKFIEKKNPMLILDSIKFLPDNIRSKVVLLFMGSGELEPILKEKSNELKRQYNINVLFLGFINQSAINRYYLATDILVLPSRQLGETWGLVVNEALNAGCSVVVSEHVGSSVEFKHLERFKVISDSNPHQLADAVTDLSKFEHNFGWATEYMKNYSINSAATAIVNELKKLS